ncbi:MAG: MarC family protein [Alphaproteobacteria bacterium]|nr:MarC family protein [Alphaproteobacteria bacterium]
MHELFIGTFVTFFVVIDPLGIAPIFAVMTEGASGAFKRRMVFKASITGAIILLLFAFLGNGLLSALGISMTAFKTAGGFLLFMIALEMVFEKRTERREKKSEGLTHEHEEGANAIVETDDDFEDISVFPIAIPFISGPGSIATIMLLMSHHQGNFDEQGVVIGALLAALLSTIVILLAASKIIGMLGHTVAGAITRVLGVILAAMATQYMFDGIREAFFGA